MSSSTSSSSRARLALLVALALLLAIEIGLRASASRLSADRQHTVQVPQIAADLRSARRPRILFLGNSITYRGVDAAAVSAVLRQNGFDDPAIAIVRPDDTSVLEWFYLFRTFFAESASAEREIDLVVVPFVREQLSDPAIDFEELERISSYVGWQQLSYVSRDLELDFEQTTQLYLSRLVHGYRHRQRIERRILSHLPQYRVAARRMNDVRQQNATQTETYTSRSSTPPIEDMTETTEDRSATNSLDSGVGSNRRRNYRFLDQLLEVFRTSQTPAVFVATPIGSGYDLDPYLADRIEAGGGALIDARNIPGISEGDFLDTYHLDPTGAKTFSSFIADHPTISNRLRDHSLPRSPDRSSSSP